MAEKITDETIDYVGILAKLKLSPSEREDAKADMQKMLESSRCPTRFRLNTYSVRMW